MKPSRGKRELERLRQSLQTNVLRVRYIVRSIWITGGLSEGRRAAVLCHLIFRKHQSWCVTMGMVKEALRQTIRRRLDEPKLELAETISIKDGGIGVVLARYSPSGVPNEVRYILEIISDEADKAQSSTK
jgi:hypothetical protein